MYIRIINGRPQQYSIAQLRADHPHISFPRLISDELLVAHDVDRVKTLPPPDYNPVTQQIVLGDPVQRGDAWVREWSVADLPSDMIDPKMRGVEFEGVMCSATSQDQAGLMAVLLAIQMQGAAFRPTRFEFANGSTIVISLQNYQQFTAAWMPFRQSFFAV